MAGGHPEKSPLRVYRTWKNFRNKFQLRGPVSLKKIIKFSVMRTLAWERNPKRAKQAMGGVRLT